MRGSRPQRSALVCGSLVVLALVTEGCLQRVSLIRPADPNASGLNSSIGAQQNSKLTTTEVELLGTPILTATAGQNVTLSMRFTAVPMAGDYQVLVHFIASDGSQLPFGGDHAPPVPTSKWSGLIAYDDVVSIPSSTPSGSYAIMVGLYPNIPPYTQRIPLLPGKGVAPDDATRYAVGILNINASGGGTSSPPSTSGSGLLGGFMVGQHFHQAQNPIMHKYLFARTHDNTAVSDGKMKWWTGDDQYDFSALDAFRDQHKANGAKILITFFGSPQWASARPNEGNYKYPAWTGGLAEPRDLSSYGRMVQATVGRYKNDLYAVECWNEPFMDTYNGYQPDNQHSEFFTGSPTALADMCKALSQNTKAVSPSTPVICPAEAYFSPIVVNAKTSQGESILNYCDAIGWHPYGYTGVAGVGGDLAGYIDQINQWTAAAGHPNMPIVITEWGVDYYGDVANQFQSMSSSSKANVLYQTLSVAYQKGVKGFAFYSYDDGYCGINGSDSTTAAGITRGVQDFGGK